MKCKLWQFVVASTLLLSACGQSPATNTPAADSTFTPTVSPSETIQPSATFSLTATQIPATLTITPLPTISTFTPTFDARTVVTVTPASPAECPKEDPTQIADFKIPTENDRVFIGTDNEILNFLNKGGTLQSVFKRLNGNGKPTVQDVTGDGVSELIFSDFGAITRLHVFKCSNGSYQLFSPSITSMPEDTFYSSYLEAIKDLNQNNVSDIIISQRGGSGSGLFKVTVYEWNGEEFIDLAPNVTMSGLLDAQIDDINKDGLREILLHGGLSGECCMPGEYPRRMFIDIYRWTGIIFDYSGTQYDPPIFRFQAIQDADQYSLNNENEKALGLYQDVIFSDKLEWWSELRAEFTRQTFQVSPPSWPDISPPPMDQIPADITYEYNSLAAYAYYRIVLLHIMQNHESDAGTVYNTLQQKFGADPYGHPYAEMATSFWETYQSTHKMYNGCAAAIHYAVEHPAILIPLGSNYHGAQSHTYVPAEVCPFR